MSQVTKKNEQVVEFISKKKLGIAKLAIARKIIICTNITFFRGYNFGDLGVPEYQKVENHYSKINHSDSCR